MKQRPVIQDHEADAAPPIIATEAPIAPIAPMAPTSGIEVEHARRITLAAWQNDVPLIERIVVHNNTDAALINVTVELTADPPFCAPWTTQLERIHPRSLHVIDTVDVQVSTDDLVNRTERVKGHIWVSARSGATRLGQTCSEVELLAPAEWPGVGQLPELLAAFILPNANALVPVMKDAAAQLGKDTDSSALDGYQSKDRRRVQSMTRALYTALQASGVTYVNPPASFEEYGQKIRSASQVVGQLGTCLDLSTTLCALLEQVGLHPLLVIVKGHAFVGVWLTEFSSPQPTIDDCARLSKRVKLGELLVFDSSPVATGGTFETARASANRHLDDPDNFRFALDVRRARRLHIRPLPLADEGGRIDTTRLFERPTPSPIEGDTPAGLPALEGTEWLDETHHRTRIERWKDRLLDLSLRNRLLNFRLNKQTFEFVGLNLASLEDVLAASTPMELHARGELRPGRGGRAAPITAIGDDGLDHGYAADEQTEGRLRVDLTQTEFEKRVLEIYRRANSSLKESGAVTLYLGLGMLRWYESKSSDMPRLAPLLLLPVTLERGRGSKPWRLTATDDQIRFNSTLLRKLSTDFGLDGSALDQLPEDSSGVDVERILNRVRRLVVGQDRWDVINRCVLAQFSFAKFLMWLDLEERSDQLMANPIVKQMMEGRGKMPWAAAPVPTHKLDSDRSPAKIFNVVDADPSQLQAILAASDGASFVLQGPPGTGKSQTITNLIAQLMAEGKKVLFVSEKMAALEVVYDRLSRVGLGPFCLELHSQKSNKRAVMAQLKEAFTAIEESPGCAWQANADQLATTRKRLNDFAAALARQTPLGGTVQSGLARLLTLDKVQVPERVLTSAPSADLVNRLRLAAPAIERACAVVGDLKGHPLRELQADVWSPAKEREVASVLDGAINALKQLADCDATSARALGLPTIDATEGYGDRLTLCETLLAGPVAARALIEQRPDQVAQRVDRLLQPVKAHRQAWASAAEVFNDDVLTFGDLPVVHQQYRRWANSNVLVAWFMLWLLGPHRRLSSLAAQRRLPVFAAVLRALDAVRLTLTERANVEALDSSAQSLLGPLWAGRRTDPEEIQRQVDHSAALHQAILLQTADTGAESRARLRALATEDYGLLAKGTERRKALKSLSGAVSAWRHASERLAAALGVDPALLDGGLGGVREVLSRWQANVGQLRDWCTVRAELNPLNEMGLGRVTAQILEGRMEPSTLGEVFERIVHEAWWEQVLNTEPTFRDFRGIHHEALIRRFRELDTELMSLARTEVRSRIASRAPRLNAPGDEMAILVRQLKLKARHKPLRTLFSEIPGLLGRIKPCVLMSPLSVAQYLDPKLDGFDVVIFDEASQIPPWDAIGALARGHQAVIVGDSKQLPPTSFFGSGGADDEDADEFDLCEMESILDEAAATLPERMLRWHYRSRHESLIAFSNHHYYDNQLNTFPSASLNTPELGVKWRHVPNGFYDRGRSRTNRAEAEAVVAEIAQILMQADPPTVGVVTFSMAQQRLIEDLVDELRQRRPELESHFVGDESVFIKNLENVQGDERDVMLFSIGYGPDKAGKIAMNFGPLNRQGGERRLNVAITRARQRLLVFSTLRAEQIDLSRTRALGARHLKIFLSYAERGMVALDAAIHLDPDQEPESPFEAQVKRKIEALGWTVHAQIGCSGYRIDLAVVDPESPGAYLLGIECDGATYHSSATARERDRLRQQVLEGLGWTIHRVWSTDWWFQKDAQMERLSEAIAQAQRAAADRRVARAAREAAALARPSMVLNPGAQVATPSASPQPLEVVAPTNVEPATPSFEQLLAAATATACTAPEHSEHFSWPDTPTLGAPEAFYSAAGCRQAQEVLGEMVQRCGPMLREDVFRCVLKCWALRLSKNPRQELEARWAALMQRGFKQTADGSLWPPELDPLSWRGVRVPMSGEASTTRGAEQLPCSEIANAAEWVLDQAKSIGRAELNRETAKVFGLMRMTSKVKVAMARGLERLVSEQRAVITEGRVTLPEDDSRLV